MKVREAGTVQENQENTGLLSVRRMRTEDSMALEALERLCFSDVWHAGTGEKMAQNGLDEVWLLEDQKGVLCGYINYRFLAGEGELMRIAVHPSARGRGYARKLMAQMEKAATQNEVRNLTLEVRAGSHAAIKLYKSYGFECEAVRKAYYREPVEDALIMWRRQHERITT